MRIEQVVIPTIRSVVKRPKLAAAVFRFDPWGNPFGPDRYSYPYPIYDRMREAGPVIYHRVYRNWFVVGHSAARAVLASSDAIVSTQREIMLSIRPYTKLSAHARSFLDNFLLLIDPPDHTRLRRLVSRAFSPRQMARIEPAVERIAATMVADLRAEWDRTEQPVDFAATFAEPLPIRVICELLGIPEDRWEWAGEVSRQISKIGNLIVGFDPVEVSAAIDDLHRYVLELAAKRRVDPRDDLVTALAEVGDDGDSLSDDELVAMVGILMFAGHETTSGFLGNSVLALADHPGQRRLLIEQPDLSANAVEELLRWDTAVQTDPRTATADIPIGDVTIRAGENVVVMLGAANRDPDFYNDPNTLRLDRNDPQPVSFGHGIHHCLGHALARMESRVALRTFLDVFGEYEVERGSIDWRQSIVTKGPTRLRVSPDKTRTVGGR
jgi:cytochrome P450